MSDGERFVVSTYADGQTVKKRIEPDEKPKREAAEAIRSRESRNVGQDQEKAEI